MINSNNSSKYIAWSREYALSGYHTMWTLINYLIALRILAGDGESGVASTDIGKWIKIHNRKR